IVVAGRLQDVQAWAGEPGALTAISVASATGVEPEALAGRIDRVLPASVTAKTGEQAAADATAETADAIGSFLTPVLLAFAGVSVFVGAFIIFNAFSITVAQRRREFAMLRAVGAGSRQVLLSVVVEALALGTLASALGIAAGLGVAVGINQLFQALGADIPVSGLILAPRTVLIAVAVGLGVTLLSSLVPAVRATRVPPVAAMQEGQTLPPTRFSRLSTAAAALVTAAGGASLAWGIVSDGSATGRLLYMGVGALLLFLAVAMLAKFIVRPVSRVIGWPLERIAPVVGRLARENAGRNPSRTAATAAALMIGLAMVVFVAVFAEALKGSFSGAISDSTRADLVAQDRGSFLTVPQSATWADVWGFKWEDGGSDELLAGLTAAAPEKAGDAAAVGSGDAAPSGSGGAGSAAPSRSSDAVSVAPSGSGDDPITGGVLLEAQSAAAKQHDAGDTITVTAPSGRTAELTILGFYRDSMVFTGMITGLGTFAALDIDTAAGLTWVRTEDGASQTATQKTVQQVLADFPTQDVMTKAEYLDMIGKQVDQILTMFYGLLAMSVVISIFGIVNTLVLSVHERTRELGMLRAIGATRSQLRRMVRYESVITTVIGGILGTAVGVLFAYLIVTQMGGDGLVFSVPWLQLGLFMLLAAAIGVLAAVLPARRAANIRILEAI
ncbi:MAG: FtsX-like permease family protein, partial [Actinobacteria bacterium]|nr:FtsX-like permease family protein [Actinomycetota bacterium]